VVSCPCIYPVKERAAGHLDPIKAPQRATTLYKSTSYRLPHAKNRKTGCPASARLHTPVQDRRQGWSVARMHTHTHTHTQTHTHTHIHTHTHTHRFRIGDKGGVLQSSGPLLDSGRDRWFNALLVACITWVYGSESATESE